MKDCLEAGPSLNPLPFDILLRFQEQRVAIVADIKKDNFKYYAAADWTNQCFVELMTLSAFNTMLLYV